MSDPENRSNAERLKDLERKIAEAKGPDQSKHHSEEHYSQANLAWRMVIELVAGLGIGFGIGYGLDVLLGTTPWLMVLFIFFGLAAGVNVMMRSAKEIQERQLAEQADKDGEANDGD
ncbi:AtpZ/AtpI family protein [Aestuariibius sp. HNIBRBA575]|uniref:AtpZ/AtpI family protein n=1 Tax=Aestuariibius sp. HNIBRBA575 TaxID=3233343 RepID=UPI0034A55905